MVIVTPMVSTTVEVAAVVGVEAAETNIAAVVAAAAEAAAAPVRTSAAAVAAAEVGVVPTLCRKGLAIQMTSQQQPCKSMRKKMLKRKKKKPKPK